MAHHPCYADTEICTDWINVLSKTNDIEEANEQTRNNEDGNDETDQDATDDVNNNDETEQLDKDLH